MTEYTFRFMFVTRDASIGFPQLKFNLVAVSVQCTSTHRKNPYLQSKNIIRNK